MALSLKSKEEATASNAICWNTQIQIKTVRKQQQQNTQHFDENKPDKIFFVKLPTRSYFSQAEPAKKWGWTFIFYFLKK